MTTEVTATVANYLRTIFDLEEDRVEVRRARIAERTGNSKAAVAQLLRRMGDQGLLDFSDERLVVPTKAGRDLGVALTRRHRLAERLLVDVVGLPRLQAHRVASGWELSMDKATEIQLMHLLRYPTTDAWGNPIPALWQLGFHDSPILLPGLPLSEAVRDAGPVKLSVQAFSEHLLNDECTITRLIEAGIEPGATIVARRQGAAVCVSGNKSVELPTQLAGSIHVTLLGAADTDAYPH